MRPKIFENAAKFQKRLISVQTNTPPTSIIIEYIYALNIRLPNFGLFSTSILQKTLDFVPQKIQTCKI